MSNIEKFGPQGPKKEAQPNDDSGKVDMKRRNFLKILGIGAAGAAMGAVGKKGYEAMLVSDKEEGKDRANQDTFSSGPERHELSDDEIIGRESGMNPPQHQLSDDEIIGRESGTNPPRHEFSDDEIIGRDVNKK